MGRSTKVVFEVTKIFYILIEVVLTEMYTFVKTPLIVYIKSMRLVDCELNLT